MVKFAELPNDYFFKYYKRLPQIDVIDVRLLWIESYQDFPLSGVLIYKGKKHWYQCFDEEEVIGKKRASHDGGSWEDLFVRYLIIELSKEQIIEEERWHKTFQEMVGTHLDFDEYGERNFDGYMPDNNHDEYFDFLKTRKPRHLSNNNVVGWFERFFRSWAKSDQK